MFPLLPKSCKKCKKTETTHISECRHTASSATASARHTAAPHPQSADAFPPPNHPVSQPLRHTPSHTTLSVYTYTIHHTPTHTHTEHARSNTVKTQSRKKLHR